SKKHCFKSINLSNKIAIEFVFFILIISLLSGCASQKGEKKDPFFEKWKIKAEQSEGFSPSVRRRAVDLPEKAIIKEKAEQEGVAPEMSEAVKPEKTLPSDKISMKMRDIELPVLLRTLAKAANQNIIINEKVIGKVNINIENASWDQAFKGILRSYGLAYTWEGDIIRILTLEDMQQDVARETQKREMEKVEPFVTKTVQINYACPVSLGGVLGNFLSEKGEGKTHGSVMIDKHTNSIVMHAMKKDIEGMLNLIDEIDRPTRQILIKATIVETSRETARALGIQWSGLYQRDMPEGKTEWVTSGLISSGGLTLEHAVENLGTEILNVQLSALEEEGKLNILSSPSITTLDNQEAFIESGDEISYEAAGGTTTSPPEVQFKKAVLKLKVTPHVIDDKTIKIKIEITKDEPDPAYAKDQEPPLITKKAETTVILFDGQTTVIGGISKEKTSESESGVPWLRKIPLLGYLFKSEYKSKDMDEMLIFITPHILKERVKDKSRELEKQIEIMHSSEK
ncbi:MAG: type IV pilus secretin PilQ, partial [Planctomycetes bacterium]|nr:type IV pilus secretin PilQ [Planctomycetota bacterium]